MKKTIALTAAVSAACLLGLAPGLSAALAAPASAKPSAAAQKTVWKLVFQDDFNGKKLDPKTWSRIDRGNPDWQRNMTTNAEFAVVKNGVLTLLGDNNKYDKSDPREILTGGVTSQGHCSMKYGKVEAKIRIETVKGAWPAFWMMPDDASAGWPKCGEIDILERLNFDPFVYQTVHSGWTHSGHKNDPAHGGKGQINPDGWNVYGLEWYPDKLVWTVNGRETFSYAKKPDNPAQWPFDKPFYVRIDMQLGGQWVGGVDKKALPAKMHVDWIKFYQGKRGRETIGEFKRTSAK